MYDWGKLFKGCVSYEENEQGIWPQRFTKKQLAFYASKGGAVADRANGTAGIRMDFFTSAQTISFEYEANAYCRPALYFDVYENGILTGVVKEPDKSLKGKVSYQKRTEGKTRLTIYLPYTCDIHIKNPDFGEITYVTEEKPCYLAIGDSITQGMDGKNSSMGYPSILARYFDWNVINNGVGGYYYDPDVLDEDAPVKPNVITVAYGANDCHLISVGQKTFDSVERDMKLFYDKLATVYPDAKVYAITPLWKKGEYEEESVHQDMQKLRSIITKEASGRGFSIVDGNTLVPHDGEFFGDGALHPNEAGFFSYAMNLQKAVKQ